MVRSPCPGTGFLASTGSGRRRSSTHTCRRLFTVATGLYSSCQQPHFLPFFSFLLLLPPVAMLLLGLLLASASSSVNAASIPSLSPRSALTNAFSPPVYPTRKSASLADLSSALLSSRQAREDAMVLSPPIVPFVSTRPHKRVLTPRRPVFSQLPLREPETGPRQSSRSVSEAESARTDSA